MSTGDVQGLVMRRGAYSRPLEGLERSLIMASLKATYEAFCSHEADDVDSPECSPPHSSAARSSGTGQKLPSTTAAEEPVISRAELEAWADSLLSRFETEAKAGAAVIKQLDQSVAHRPAQAKIIP